MPSEQQKQNATPRSSGRIHRSDGLLPFRHEVAGRSEPRKSSIALVVCALITAALSLAAFPFALTEGGEVAAFSALGAFATSLVTAVFAYLNRREIRKITELSQMATDAAMAPRKIAASTDDPEAGVVIQPPEFQRESDQELQRQSDKRRDDT